jgi:hypothetical protein
MVTDLKTIGKAGSTPSVGNGSKVGSQEKNNSIEGVVVVKENQYHVANIRNYPDFKNTSVIAKEVPGAKLSYFDKSNDKRWYKVVSSKGGKIGWIFNTLVKEQPVVTPPKPQAPAAAVEEKLDPEKRDFFITSISDLPVNTLIEIAEAAANGAAKDVYITQYDPKTYFHYSKTFSPKEISQLLQDTAIKDKFGIKALEIIKTDPEIYAAYGDHFNALKPYLPLAAGQKIISFKGMKDGSEKAYTALIEKKGNVWVLYSADKVGFAVAEIKELNGGFNVIEKHVLFAKGKAHPATEIAASSYASKETKGSGAANGTGDKTQSVQEEIAEYYAIFGLDPTKVTITKDNKTFIIKDLAGKNLADFSEKVSDTNGIDAKEKAALKQAGIKVSDQVDKLIDEDGMWGGTIDGVWSTKGLQNYKIALEWYAQKHHVDLKAAADIYNNAPDFMMVDRATYEGIGTELRGGACKPLLDKLSIFTSELWSVTYFQNNRTAISDYIKHKWGDASSLTKAQVDELIDILSCLPDINTLPDAVRVTYFGIKDKVSREYAGTYSTTNHMTWLNGDAVQTANAPAEKREGDKPADVKTGDNLADLEANPNPDLKAIVTKRESMRAKNPNDATNLKVLGDRYREWGDFPKAAANYLAAQLKGGATSGGENAGTALLNTITLWLSPAAGSVNHMDGVVGQSYPAPEKIMADCKDYYDKLAAADKTEKTKEASGYLAKKLGKVNKENKGSKPEEPEEHLMTQLNSIKTGLFTHRAKGKAAYIITVNALIEKVIASKNPDAINRLKQLRDEGVFREDNGKGGKQNIANIKISLIPATQVAAK